MMTNTHFASIGVNANVLFPVRMSSESISFAKIAGEWEDRAQIDFSISNIASFLPARRTRYSTGCSPDEDELPIDLKPRRLRYLLSVSDSEVLRAMRPPIYHGAGCL
jgi:hypothetical protein